MAGETVRVRFERGDIVLELDGDAAVVQTLLSGYRKNGYGRILDFFNGSDPPTTITPTTPTTAPLTPLMTVARTLRFAVDHITLPQSREQFAFDLTGDGRADNQFGNIVGALMAQNLDLQAAVDEGISSGPTLLFQLDTSNAALGVDQRADLTVRVGTADPNGGYVVDPTVVPVKLPGLLTAGRFATPAPAVGAEPPVVQLSLRLLSGGSALRLPLRAVRVAFAVATTGTKLTDGHIHGALAKTDVDTAVVPGLAAMLSAEIAADPISSRSQQIAALFDTGGCVNPDGTQAEPGDGVIDVCELLTNPIMKNVLSPDVQLYDATGRFAPVGGPTRDSLSIGVGFTGVAQV